MHHPNNSQLRDALIVEILHECNCVHCFRSPDVVGISSGRLRLTVSFGHRRDSHFKGSLVYLEAPDVYLCSPELRAIEQNIVSLIGKSYRRLSSKLSSVVPDQFYIFSSALKGVSNKKKKIKARINRKTRSPHQRKKKRHNRPTPC